MEWDIVNSYAQQSSGADELGRDRSTLRLIRIALLAMWRFDKVDRCPSCVYLAIAS